MDTYGKSPKTVAFYPGSYNVCRSNLSDFPPFQINSNVTCHKLDVTLIQLASNVLLIALFSLNTTGFLLLQ